MTNVNQLDIDRTSDLLNQGNVLQGTMLGALAVITANLNRAEAALPDVSKLTVTTHEFTIDPQQLAEWLIENYTTLLPDYPTLPTITVDQFTKALADHMVTKYVINVMTSTNVPIRHELSIRRNAGSTWFNLTTYNLNSLNIDMSKREPKE